MPVQVIWNFHKNPQIKAFQHSRVGNSMVISPILQHFKLLQDFMPVLVVCKFEKNLIKTEDIIMETSLWENFSALKGE